MTHRPWAIIQARMGSSRLPGKTMADLAGVPVLGRVIERTAVVPSLQGTVVATTLSPGDDPIEEYCKRLGVPCFRGNEEDVLGRYMECANVVGAGAVVRITSDCPLLDPELLDFLVSVFREREGAVDYLCNILPPSFPDGLDLEIVSREALEKVWKEAADPAEREHVTLHIWRNADSYRLVNVRNRADESGLRWTLDTAKDLESIRTIFESIGSTGNPLFGLDEVLKWLDGNEKLKSAVTGKDRRQNSLTVEDLLALIEDKNIETVWYAPGEP